MLCKFLLKFSFIDDSSLKLFYSGTISSHIYSSIINMQRHVRGTHYSACMHIYLATATGSAQRIYTHTLADAT